MQADAKSRSRFTFLAVATGEPILGTRLRSAEARPPLTNGPRRPRYIKPPKRVLNLVFSRSPACICMRSPGVPAAAEPSKFQRCARNPREDFVLADQANLQR